MLAVPEEELFELARRAWPFRELQRSEFDDVVRMLAEGFTTRRGRRGALVHHDAVNGRLRPRRGTRLAALTSGGAANRSVVARSTRTRRYRSPSWA